jgi:integron integrase
MNVAITANPTQKTAIKRRLRDEFSDWMRMKNYRNSTISAYVSNVLDFVLFCGKRDPRELSKEDVNRFLSMLANKRDVTWKTQNQNLCALVLFYDKFLEKPLGDIGKFSAASKPSYLPVVFSRDEVRCVLAAMTGLTRLCALLQYGCGLRVGEVVRLMVKDIDFGRGVLTVIDGKGGKHRQVPLPSVVVQPLQEHLERLKLLFDQDGGWQVALPHAYSQKNPSAARSWAWQYVMSARALVRDDRDGVFKKYHIFEETVQRAVGRAIHIVGISKKACTHTFRHSFATHFLEDGGSIYDLQKLLGHSRIETTQIYNHVMSPAERRVKMPIDSLLESKPTLDCRALSPA